MTASKGLTRIKKEVCGARKPPLARRNDLREFSLTRLRWLPPLCALHRATLPFAKA